MKELFLPPELSCEIGEIYESMASGTEVSLPLRTVHSRLGRARR